MTGRTRILFAGLFHETHTFVPERTPLSDFTIRHGPDILARRGDGSTIDGFLEVAAEEGWESSRRRLYGPPSRNSRA